MQWQWIAKARSSRLAAQYNGTFGSTVRAQPSIPPRIECTFSNPCCRSQFVTVSERHAMMAHHHNMRLRIQFLMRSRRHIAHRNVLRALNPRRLILPRLAHIEQRKRLAGLLQRLHLSRRNLKLHPSPATPSCLCTAFECPQPNPKLKGLGHDLALPLEAWKCWRRDSNPGGQPALARRFSGGEWKEENPAPKGRPVAFIHFTNAISDSFPPAPLLSNSPALPAPTRRMSQSAPFAHQVRRHRSTSSTQGR